MRSCHRILLFVFGLLSFCLIGNLAFSFETSETEVSCSRSLAHSNLILSVERDFNTGARYAVVEVYNKKTHSLDTRIYNLTKNQLFYQRFGSDLKPSTLQFSGRSEDNLNTFTLVIPLVSTKFSYAIGSQLSGDWSQLNCSLETELEQMPQLTKKVSE